MGADWLLQSSRVWNENHPPSVMFLGGLTTKCGFLSGIETLPIMSGVTSILATLTT
jgi:hypothetical protein